MESVIPSLQTIIDPQFTLRLLWSFVPRGTHSRIDPEKEGVVWGSTRNHVDSIAATKCTGVKEKHVWWSEEKIVSVWSEWDYLVSTSSRADARISACACTSKPVNLCESVCTPAIFQLAFILAWSVFSCPNTSTQAVWKKRSSTKEVALVGASKFWKSLLFFFALCFIHKYSRWCF